MDGNSWSTIATADGTLSNNALLYLVQGSYHTADSIGNNPGHGGYSESIKSKGINPKFISSIWKASCVDAVKATASLEVGSKCVPCGQTQFARVDVKGSPALRFLNHNAYALGDSANICCADGQEYLDPVLVIAEIGKMLLLILLLLHLFKKQLVEVL